ncbi:MAG TPA: GTPase HflX [Nitrososphaeraceae archaeon]|jgi:GTP-binding protein HflX|nr:GTPase HflX [Nitrososphaeraceae archaeon]
MERTRSAILITYPQTESIEEAIALADAAGFKVWKIVTQKKITRSRFGIGHGKAVEVQQMVRTSNPDVIIFDEVLKPSQQYNVASMCRIEVMDREKLILDIFERRANTKEATIQVKLAELRYETVRIKDKVRLAKLGEQPGFFGLGKYDADVYSLDLRKRISFLKKKLEKEKKKREMHRIQRAKSGLPTVSIAGYTSAGKTTLFNRLTRETKRTGEGMFTTLSTYTRSFKANGSTKLLISDTIGFINKLPPYMIDAFRSTLNEMTYSDLTLLVIDGSDALNVIDKKIRSSTKIINELMIPLTRILYLFNKADLIEDHESFVKELTKSKVFDPSACQFMLISSRTGYNIGKLEEFLQLRFDPQL